MTQHTESRSTKTEKSTPPRKVAEPVRYERPKAPSRFVRWMGWLLAVVAVAGLAGAVWYGLSTEESVPVASPDRHVTAALQRDLAEPLVAPATVDPYLNPEIRWVTPAAAELAPELYGEFSGSVFVAPATVDPYLNPEIRWVTPATAELAPELYGEFSGSVFVAPSIDEIDPHESPEIRWAR